MTVAELAESLATAPVLVFGSPPPGGRDLDLLVRPAEADALAAGLHEAGFLQRGNEWARFGERRVELAELIPAAAFGLPPAELDALYREALPIEGFRRLVRPAPHHVLLIVARRVVRDGYLDAKRRSRIDEALQEEPEAWGEARARAVAWRAEPALAALERAYASGGPVKPWTRARAIRGELEARGRSPVDARLRAWRSALGPRRRGPIFSLSGLDGAGKSSQAAALRDALLELGLDVAVQWTRISHNPTLDVISAPVKRILGLRAGQPDEPVDERAAARALRERNPLVRQVWVSIVAIGSARSHRRATLPHVRRGRAVVCDRYTLDAIVQLRHTYGERRRFGFQIALIRVFSPAPRLAFLLDIRPETALARKADDYDQEELEEQARLYRWTAAELGVICLDGTRPRDDLSAEIARAVWQAL